MPSIAPTLLPSFATFSPGPAELFWVFLIVVVVFGAKKLPQLGASFGKGIKNFKKEMREASEDEPSGDTLDGPPQVVQVEVKAPEALESATEEKARTSSG